jgi:glycosyltransferase involved in cell wall biosynthesis
VTNLVVLIPVYGNQSGLDRTLANLRGARGRFEAVLVDDGSPQPLSAPVRLREGLDVTTLRLEKNRGIAGALNHGLRYILERPISYIARLDAGDTVAPERFERQMRFLESHPGCSAVSSFVDFVDTSQRFLFRYRAPCTDAKIRRRLRLNNCLVHSGSMMRSSVLRELGVYREDLPGAEDYELFLRMARSYSLAVLPEVLTRCEYSLNGLSVGGRRQQQWERVKLQLRYFDAASPFSFYGIARTLVAMLVPHRAVYRLKTLRG